MNHRLCETLLKFIPSMPVFAQQPIPDAAASTFVLMVAGAMMLCFLVAWIYLANRATAAKPILPRYEPRRNVPWTGLDLILIVLFYLSSSFVAHVALFGWPKPSPAAREAAPAIDRPKTPEQPAVQKTAAHPLAQLLKDKDPKILLLCLSVGVVIVPVFEEFFFRVLFTGWLLAVERRWRRKWKSLRVPRAIIPIAVTSLVFASLHYRAESREIPETNLVLSMFGLAAVSIATFVFAIVWIALRHRVSAREFGWDARKWPDDLGIGACAYFAMALPIYAMQIAFSLVLPSGIAPDPIVLFFFAVVLGALYFRTSRALPSIVMHMLLNAGSLGLAWAMM
jgi:membrane protease YdiL (CAAX protease family)